MPLLGGCKILKIAGVRDSKKLGKGSNIDRSYCNEMVGEAAQTIIAYGDFTWFVFNDHYCPPSFEKGKYMDNQVYELEEVPWKEYQHSKGEKND